LFYIQNNLKFMILTKKVTSVFLYVFFILKQVHKHSTAHY